MNVDIQPRGRLWPLSARKRAPWRAERDLAPTDGLVRSSVYCRSLIPALLALCGAAVLIAYTSTYSEPLFWASLGLLLVNSVALTTALTAETRYGSAHNSYRHFLALSADAGSIAVVFVAMVVGAKLGAAAAVVGFMAYVVVLLCALIRSNAMKKPAHAKWVRVGRLTRLVVALVLLGSVWEASELRLVGRFGAAELAAIVLAGCAIAIAALRAARVRALLALRDPAVRSS